MILCGKMALRPKSLLIDRFRIILTLSGRRWKPHGSSKESGGKKAGSKKEASKEGGSEEEIIFIISNYFINGFYCCSFPEQFLIVIRNYCIKYLRKNENFFKKPNPLEDEIPIQHTVKQSFCLHTMDTVNHAFPF